VAASIAACHASPAPGLDHSGVDSRPAARWLAPLTLGSDVKHWRVTIRGVRDTADRLLSEKTVTQVPLDAPAGEMMISFAWRPPLTSVDSLVVLPKGLLPVREVLSFNGFIRHYQYDGAHVRGTVEHADSAARVVDKVFSEPVFAFNEVDLLVRSTPFRRGWSVVVPLFSEADEDVEHDTITVNDSIQVHRNGSDATVWVIRFADPAIVSTYSVLAESREILSVDTEQRRSHAVIRYRDTEPPA
jgi:hypothetical protein